MYTIDVNENPDMEQELEQMQFGEPGNELPEELRAIIEATDHVYDPRHNKVVIPQQLSELKSYVGAIYGFIREDSGYHVVLGWDGNLPIPELKTTTIGWIGEMTDGNDAPAVYIRGRYTDEGELDFALISNGIETKLTAEVYLLKQDVFSRNSGLIETDWLDDKCVVLSGCGSVGSCMALQLARSGVGNFILFDTDCMEIHNVCRHQCNLTDIGRYKVDAVEERILQINPAAKVHKFYECFQDVYFEEYSQWVNPKTTLFIGACDNRVGNAYACDRAYEIGAPFLALGFMTRAWAGEMFVCVPERHDVCYRCAYYGQIQEDIIRERSRNYINAEDIGTVSFVPGMDVELEYGVSIADKVALDLLNRYNRDYSFRLVHKLSQLTVFTATADRTGVSEGWKKLLPDPICYRRISVRSNSRKQGCRCWVDTES